MRLPTVDTASCLASRVRRGDAVILRKASVCSGGIQARKAIFRKAALANVPLLRQMEQALKAKSNRTLSEEFFRDSSTNTSARANPAASSKLLSSGAATPKFSITTPPPAS